MAKEELTQEEIQAKLDAKFKDLSEKMKKGATKEEVDALTLAMKKQGESLQEFIDIERKGKQAGKSFSACLDEFLEKNQDELKKIYKSKSGEVEFLFDFHAADKAAADIHLGNGSISGAVPALNDANLAPFNLRNDNQLIALCTTVPTNSASYPYTETFPKDGDYEFVAEGGIKPKIDFSWVTRYVTPFKIAAHETLSEEVITDVPRMMSTATDLLKKKHDLFKVDGVYFGDGSPGVAKGATLYARTFVAGAMAGRVATPNIMDVINACITDIYTTQNYVDESPYMANTVLMNPVDFFVEFQAAKDGNSLPLYGGVMLFEEYRVGRVSIKPWHKIPAGKIFVADMSKYNLSDWVRYSVRIGWINDQFITNEFTMVGESRFHAFVKNFDEQAFIYDDIANIITAIATVVTLAQSLGVDSKEAKKIQSDSTAKSAANRKAKLKERKNPSN